MVVVYDVPYKWEDREYHFRVVNKDWLVRAVQGRNCWGVPFNPAPPYNSHDTWYRKFSLQRPYTNKDRLFLITVLKATIKKQMEDN